MNPTDYVQTRCQKCGSPAWGHNTQTVACGTCGQPIAPLASSAWNPASPYGVAQPPGAAAMQQGMQAAGMPPGAQAFQNPQPFGAGTQPGSNNGAPPMAASGGPSVNVQMPFGLKIPVKLPGGGAGKAKVIGSVVLVGVLGVAGAVLKGKFMNKNKKGMLSYSALSMDMKKIDADKMIPAVESTAKAWRSDAVFLSINLQEVHADGTVDASGGGAQVEYVSPSRANGLSKKLREDAFKKFSFGPSGVDYKDQWDALEKADMPDHPPFPHCGIKNVVKQLAAKGLTGDKTVRITFDPVFNTEAWHAIGEDPKIDELFSIEDCSPMAK
jgi:ribosomal protein L37E